MAHSKLIENLVTTMANNGKTGKLAVEYYQAMPGMIADWSGGSAPKIRDQMKRTPALTAHGTFMPVLEAVRPIAHRNEELAADLLEQSLPGLLAISTLQSAQVDGKSMNQGIVEFAQQVGKGHVSLMSPLCPPYTYSRDNRGVLVHASGELQPAIGSGLNKALSWITGVVRPVMQHGVACTLNLFHYSGNDAQQLIEVGADTLNHYRSNEGEMLAVLQSAYGDLQLHTDLIARQTGMQISVQPVEQFSPAIQQTVDQYAATFPQNAMSLRAGWQEDNIGEWLSETVGVPLGWLETFVDEEGAYRSKQRVGQSPEVQPLVHAALSEGLLYNAICAQATDLQAVILDMETTPDYMKVHTSYSPTPLMMGNDDNGANIRQPWNQIW